MARIVGHLPVEELEARHRAARDATEARHLQAIWLLAQGRTVLEVSEVLAFVPRWVTRLAARHNASGPGALGDRRRRNGRAASLLTGAALSALAERVRTPPGDGGVWSGPKVAAWMARRLGLAKVHPQRGWEDRGDPATWPLAQHGSRRVRHARLGRLVQPPPPPRADRQHTAHRGGGTLLCSARGIRPGGVTH